MTVAGWLMKGIYDGSVALYHTSGLYVAGFDSKVAAGVWLCEYLLRQQREQGRSERARLRLLGQMAVQGRPS